MATITGGSITLTGSIFTALTAFYIIDPGQRFPVDKLGHSLYDNICGFFSVFRHILTQPDRPAQHQSRFPLFLTEIGIP